MSGDPRQPPERRMGQGMLVLGWLLALAVLTWYFAGVERRQINPNASASAVADGGGTLEVTLQRNRQGHYLAQGSINGESATFLLDTGATDVVVPAGLAERAGLRRGAAGMAATANGMVRVYSTRIDSVEFAGIELRDIRASINARMGEDAVLLGMSALKHIEFSQRGGALTLRQF